MTRSSGVLMHLSSLPNKYGVGTLGKDAFDFVDFLVETKQKMWQILPIGPTGYGNSPYQSYSGFAGNLLFISLELLVEEGLLTNDDLADYPVLSESKVEYDLVTPVKTRLLRKAFAVFQSDLAPWTDEYHRFLQEHSWWLTDYCLFRALKGADEDLCWNEWDAALKKREEPAMQAALHKQQHEIDFHRFVQFIFFRQWFRLKAYANSKGIQIFGDLPLYVSLDSSDVWGNQDIFMLDEEGKMTHVGGVPPDYFSETGQYWGCPVFDWNRLAERQYDWWAARIHFNLHMFDLVRIDHFRGLESFWSIPASEENAINGEWWPANGFEMLSLLKGQLGYLPVIAEDLGIITPEVDELRDAFDLPGMKVLQFAYGGDAADVNLPHNYRENFVVYTGTHDNDTTLGWLKTASHKERENIRRYYDCNWTNLHRKVIESAWASVAKMAILPMQDLLELDGSHRMNTPGTVANNWEWRMQWPMLEQRHKAFLVELTEKYNRAHEAEEVAR